MEFLLKASAITALFYLCYKLFLQGETFFESNRWFLLSGLVFSFCVPFLIIPIYIEKTTVPSFIIPNGTHSIEPLIEESFNYLKVLLFIYGLGVTFFLVKLCIEFLSLYKLLNNNITKSSRTSKHIETEESISPFSFFNYIVYNPNQFNCNELEHIINHEKVHVKQWHSLDILLAQIATVIFWFNPFIWFYKKDLQQNLEFIADQKAQGVSSCQKSYQHLLLKATIPNQQLILVNNFYNSLIKKRIIMLHKSKSHKLNVLKYALVIPLLALFLLSFNTVEIYKPDTTPFIKNDGDIEMVIITKDFKDVDLEKIKIEFDALGVTLKFKNIKRNNAGEIIAIKIDAKTSKSNVSFNTNSEEGICPIKLVYNSESQNISIGNNEDNSGGQHDYHFSSKDGNHKIVKSVSSGKVFVFTEEHEEHDNQEDHKKRNVEIIIKDEDGNTNKEANVFIKKGSKVIHIDSDDDDTNEDVFFIKEDKDGKKFKKEIIIKSDGTQNWIEEDEDGEKHEIIINSDKNENRMLFISSDDSDTPLVMIDGKESTLEAMEKLSPDSIDMMNVLKGEIATKKYGEKAKAGVIIITTKKQ